jgi:hypothetical protein
MPVRFSTYLFSFPHIWLDGRSLFLKKQDLDLFVSITDDTGGLDLDRTARAYGRQYTYLLGLGAIYLFIFCLFVVLLRG